jgi:hypothetical protein
MDLIVFQENMNKRSKKSLAWSKRNITQELSKLEGGGARDFAREDDCIGWRGGCKEFFFQKA